MRSSCRTRKIQMFQLFTETGIVKTEVFQIGFAIKECGKKVKAFFLPKFNGKWNCRVCVLVVKKTNAPKAFNNPRMKKETKRKMKEKSKIRNNFNWVFLSVLSQVIRAHKKKHAKEVTTVAANQCEFFCVFPLSNAIKRLYNAFPYSEEMTFSFYSRFNLLVIFHPFHFTSSCHRTFHWTILV